MLPTVCVIMSTYNGEKYIQQQIESIVHQSEVDVFLNIFDDGSTDNTRNLLSRYSDVFKNIKVNYNEENMGPRNSYLNGIISSGEFDYYAFADQDDVWDDNKLLCAIDKLEKINEQSALYCSDVNIVDENLKLIGHSDFGSGSLSFLEILTRNNGIGCTFVFNKELKQKVDKMRLDLSTLSSEQLHDQWLYAICLLNGGTVIYDKASYINYRQHSNNVVGGSKRTVITKLGNILKSKNYVYKFARDLNNNQETTSTLEKELNIVANYKQSLKDMIACLKLYSTVEDDIRYKIKNFMLIIMKKF